LADYGLVIVDPKRMNLKKRRVIVKVA